VTGPWVKQERKKANQKSFDKGFHWRLVGRPEVGVTWDWCWVVVEKVRY